MARRGTEAAPDENVEATDSTEATAEQAVTENTGEATPTETPAEEVIDLSELNTAVEAQLARPEAEMEYGDIKAAYGKLSRKGKIAAKKAADETMATLLKGGAESWPKAAATMLIVENGYVSSASKASGSSTPATPKDSTAAHVDRIVGLRLAHSIATAQASAQEGIAEDWKDQVVTKATELQAQVDSLVAYRLNTAEDKGDAPEVDPIVSRAVKAAFAGSTSGRTGTGSTYTGPQRSVKAHIAQAFADQPVGTALSVAEIANFKSTEYGDDKPSAGAVSAALKSDKFNVEGVTPGPIGEKGNYGATKVA